MWQQQTKVYGAVKTGCIFTLSLHSTSFYGIYRYIDKCTDVESMRTVGFSGNNQQKYTSMS